MQANGRFGALRVKEARCLRWAGRQLREVRRLLANVPDGAIVAGFSGLIVAQSAGVILDKSATFDEVIRPLAGYLHLSAGEYRFQQDVLPLVNLLAALPLLFMDVTVPPPPPVRANWTQWVQAHDFLYRLNDADSLLLVARFAVLPLTLLLGAFVFRWTRLLFGRGAATFALFLYSFEPNFLAHGPLAGTDVAVACFSFLTLYFFWQVLETGAVRHVVMAGVCLGLALVTKHSALWLPPTLTLFGAASCFGRPASAPHTEGGFGRLATRPGGRLIQVFGSLAVMSVIVYLVIWATYRFRFEGGQLPGYAYPSPWEEFLPTQSRAGTAIQLLREVRILPEAYLYSLATFWGFLDKQPFAFLMGDISKGSWHYFLVTFALKTPLALLVLLVLAPIALMRWWRARPLPLVLLAGAAVVYFGVASLSRYNVGHRHLLPVYAPLFVLTAAVVPWGRRQKPAVKALVAGLALWYGISSASVFPHYIAYFNELAGGPEHGYRYLVDSNLDWGQDLKGLKRYMDQHGIERIWLSYFGTASPEYHGIRYNALPSFSLFHPPADNAPARYVAISATNLYGLYLPLTKASRDFFRPFLQQRPVAKIGYSIFVYRLPDRFSFPTCPGDPAGRVWPCPPIADGRHERPRAASALSPEANSKAPRPMTGSAFP